MRTSLACPVAPKRLQVETSTDGQLRFTANELLRAPTLAQPAAAGDCWVNRSKLPEEELSVMPDTTVPTLDGLVNILGGPTGRRQK